MLESAHDDSVVVILWSVDGLVLGNGLDVDLSADDAVVEGALIGKSLDVLSGVWVDVLEGTGKLVVESLDKRDNRSWDLHGLALNGNWCLLIILPLLGILNDDVIWVVLEDGQKGLKLLLGRLPLVLGHESLDTSRQVKAGRNKGEENADLLVWCLGDAVKLLHHLDLLTAVGVLLSSRLHDRSQVLENGLRSVDEATASLENSGESVIVVVACWGVESVRSLRLLWLWCNNLWLVIRLHKLVLVRSVCIDLLLVILVVLLDLLLDCVEATGAGGVHLLGSNLLLGDGLIHEVLQLGDGLDVELWSLASLNQFGDLAVDLVELCRTYISTCTPLLCQLFEAYQ